MASKTRTTMAIIVYYNFNSIQDMDGKQFENNPTLSANILPETKKYSIRKYEVDNRIRR